MLTNQQACDILQHAELIVSEEEVQAALRRLAHEINSALAGKHPLVLSVMGGGGGIYRAVAPIVELPS